MSDGVFEVVRQALGKEPGDAVPAALSIADAARASGLPVSRIRTLIRQKELRCVRGCRKPMFVTTASLLDVMRGVYA